MGVTQVNNWKVRVSGSGTTYGYGDEFVRGIVLLELELLLNLTGMKSQLQLADRVTRGLFLQQDYDELKLVKINKRKHQQQHVGIGTTSGIVDTAFDITISGIHNVATASYW